MRWLLAVGMLALTPPVVAQAGPASDSGVCATNGLVAGRLVRIHGGSSGSLIGPLVACTPEGLVLGPHIGRTEPQVFVPTRFIDVLWVRGDQRKPWMLSGLAVGAVAGYAWNAVDASLCGSDSGRLPTCPGNRALGALIGAAVGGFVGWGLGHGFPRWLRRIP